MKTSSKETPEEKKFLCITIDGPSACGKSTTAKRVAEELGIMHLDTGAIYRSIALWFLEKNISFENEEAMKEAFKSFSYKVQEDEGEKRHYVAGKDVTIAIRGNKISKLASEISTLPWIREESDKLQREIASNRSVVVDGRDAGTKVFPAADVKIFLSASIEERAKRRLQELKEKGYSFPEVTIETIQEEIKERDLRDKERKHAPLKKPRSAITIDTTHESTEEIVNKILGLVKKRQESHIKCPLFRQKILYYFCKILFSLFYRIKIEGLENCPKEGAIIASNHLSFLDPPLLGMCWPYDMHILAQEYLFRSRILKPFLYMAACAHPISSSAKDTEVIKEALSLLQQGKAILIFPEGTRSRTGNLAPLKAGVALLGALSDKPVVPTFIKGTYEIWPATKKWPRPFGRIKVTFGKPLYWQDYEAASKKETQEAFMKAIETGIRSLM